MRTCQLSCVEQCQPDHGPDHVSVDDLGSGSTCSLVALAVVALVAMGIALCLAALFGVNHGYLVWTMPGVPSRPF
jgi:hypothetical protein